MDLNQHLPAAFAAAFAASLPLHTAPLSSEHTAWDTLAGGEVHSSGRRRRGSAVLVLWLPPVEPGQPAQLVLTKRSSTLRSHRGQISFAGGRADLGDASPRTTALREAEEELGLPRDQVVTLGMLAPAKSLDGQPVYPVLAAAVVTHAELAAAAAPAEVAAVFALPWPYFAAGSGYDFSFNMFGNWVVAHRYEVPGVQVWGLTARILHSASLQGRSGLV